MSKHSKNNTSSNVFTYGERKMLKGLYGTLEQRVGQDSLKSFDMCTICHQKIVEPMACDQGHVFCKGCVLEYLVKQKKEKQIKNKLYEQAMQRKQKIEQEKTQVEQAKKLDIFQKYEHFTDLNIRKDFMRGKQLEKQPDFLVKPTGKYEVDPEKKNYTKTSFWAIEQTPDCPEQLKKQDKNVICPGSNHKLTFKKLRDIKMKQIDNEICCNLCNKEISRQKIGSYKCGHLLCFGCKGNKCEICGTDQGWIDIESSASAFASQGKAVVKKYTHAFLS